jgi:hypothetical protein
MRSLMQTLTSSLRELGARPDDLAAPGARGESPDPTTGQREQADYG